MSGKGLCLLHLRCPRCTAHVDTGWINVSRPLYPCLSSHFYESRLFLSLFVYVNPSLLKPFPNLSSFPLNSWNLWTKFLVPIYGFEALFVLLCVCPILYVLLGLMSIYGIIDINNDFHLMNTMSQALCWALHLSYHIPYRTFKRVPWLCSLACISPQPSLL